MKPKAIFVAMSVLLTVASLLAACVELPGKQEGGPSAPSASATPTPLPPCPTPGAGPGVVVTIVTSGVVITLQPLGTRESSDTPLPPPTLAPGESPWEGGGPHDRPPCATVTSVPGAPSPTPLPVFTQWAPRDVPGTLVGTPIAP